MAAHNQFWSPVVSTDYVGGVESTWFCIQDLGCTQIADFDPIIERILSDLIVAKHSFGSLQKNVFWLQIPMDNPLSMHLLKALEDLHHKVLDMLHRDRSLVRDHLLEDIFQRFVAELHHDVLDDPLLMIHRVKKLVHLNHVRGSLQQRQNLVLSTDHAARLLSPLQSNFSFSVVVIRFEHISKSTMSDDSRRGEIRHHTGHFYHDWEGFGYGFFVGLSRR